MASNPSGLDREQRLCLALHLTLDDLKAQLDRLAREGRTEDCLALLRELGDWFCLGSGSVAPMLCIGPETFRAP
jgi:hypothetical protein